jgi:Flp pilus assembly protein protease CpaA
MELVMHESFWVVTCAVLVPGILWASWIDYRERRVPNWLNAALAIAGFAAQAHFFGWSGLATAALGLIVGFAVLIVPWLMHGMGAGDVKLMMAIGVWLGPWLTFLSFCVGAVVGGVIAVVMILSVGGFGMPMPTCSPSARRSPAHQRYSATLDRPRALGKHPNSCPTVCP